MPLSIFVNPWEQEFYRQANSLGFSCAIARYRSLRLWLIQEVLGVALSVSGQQCRSRPGIAYRAYGFSDSSLPLPCGRRASFDGLSLEVEGEIAG